MSAVAITKDNFFTVPIETLKHELSSSAALCEVLKNFDWDWMTNQETSTLLELTSRVFAVSFSEDSSDIPLILLEQIETVKNLWEDKTRSFHRELLERAFDDSPTQFKQVATGLFRKLLTGPCSLKNLSEEQEKIAFLEVALKYRSTKIRDFYLQNPPLDSESPHKYDFFMVFCLWGTVDDFLLALEIYEEKKGKEALPKLVQNRGWEVGHLLMNNEEIIDAPEQVVSFYKSKDLDISTFLCRDESNKHTALTYCSTIQQYRYLLDQMTPAQIIATAEANGYAFLSFFTRSYCPKDFDEVLTKLKEIGVDLSKLHRCRNHENKTLLDELCLDGSRKHLKVLLSHINSLDKHDLLNTPNYAGRTPLQHTRWYQGSNNTLEKLLQKEME